MHRFYYSTVLAVLFLFGAGSSRVACADSSIACKIMAQNDVHIPAQVPGVLIKLPFKEEIGRASGGERG